jgi:ribonuclease P protein component
LLLHLVALHTAAPTTRVGLSVGKQVGGAAVRNLVKRRLRMLIREVQWLPGFDVVVVARPGIDRAEFEEVRRAIEQSAQRLKIAEPRRG